MLTSSKAECPLKNCPDENQWYALTQGLLEAEEVAQLEEVMDRCVACSEMMVELVRELHPTESGGLSPDDTPLPVKIGRYQVEGLLGIGGMGVLYKAQDLELQRPVALKLLRPDVTDPTQRELHIARMLQEARMLASLQHQNIPTIFEVGTWNEQVFLAIQLVQGANMREWLEAHNPDWQSLLAMYLQMGAGLIAAHKANIVHRDVKPDNILVAETGQIYITDFGLARTIHSTYHSVNKSATLKLDASNPFLTEAGEILGTPAYMAPEQYRGQGVSKRADQFAFCVSLYEGLYGMRPFAGHSMDELAKAAQAGEIFEPELTSIPRKIFQVLAKGMHPLPRERFDSMDQLLEALRLSARRPPDPIFLGLIAAAALLFGILTWGWATNWSSPFGNTKPSTFAKKKLPPPQTRCPLQKVTTRKTPNSSSSSFRSKLPKNQKKKTREAKESRTIKGLVTSPVRLPRTNPLSKRKQIFRKKNRRKPKRKLRRKPRKTKKRTFKSFDNKKPRKTKP